MSDVQLILRTSGMPYSALEKEENRTVTFRFLNSVHFIAISNTRTLVMKV